MDVGRCIKKKDDFLGCSNDVLSLLDQWCSGRQQCQFLVTNDDLEEANTNCLEILMKYLKIEYSCLKGMWYDYQDKSVSFNGNI